MKFKNRMLLIILLSVLLIVFAVVYYIIFFKTMNDSSLTDLVVEIDLNEPIEQEILIGEEYQELGAKLLIDGIDNSNLLKIDISNLDITMVGEYQVIYYVNIDGYEYKKVRQVKVIDNEAPDIQLVGGDITILLNEEYQEPGYKVSDNYDKDIYDKVVIDNKINNKAEGTYEVIYRVVDDGNNKAEVVRKVTVKKPNEIVKVIQEVKVEAPVVNETNYDNTITKNSFLDNGVYLEGYIKNEENDILRIIGETEYSYNLVIDDHKYKIMLDIDEFNNGDYKLYLNNNALLNKMSYLERISRGKVGNKLVTFIYNDNAEVSIMVQDHNYQYDVLIDAGHGGYDPGTTNAYMKEKEMNLIVSNYEKCRYEAHGLRVYLTRNADIYGNGMGLSSLPAVHRRAYEMAYYGVVSKVVYSNHHNSIANNYYGGYEIIVPAHLNGDKLANENAIMKYFNDIYPIYSGNEGHKRFYARDYDSEVLYSKENGEVYSFKDYYAVNRIPYQVSNVKSVIYEASYLSNMEDFNWYWQNKNWYLVSEAKIKVYVNSLGITYNSDNSNCL